MIFLILPIIILLYARSIYLSQLHQLFRIKSQFKKYAMWPYIYAVIIISSHCHLPILLIADAGEKRSKNLKKIVKMLLDLASLFCYTCASSIRTAGCSAAR
jgi:hypothetical protein